jgi:hypothetical protein
MALNIKETAIVRKQPSDPRTAPPTEVIDNLLHAIALVMLRRQMKGKWTSLNRTLTTTV